MAVLDPQVAAMVEAGRKAGKPPYELMSPTEARAAYAASWDVLQPAAEAVAAVADRTFPGPGGPLALRLYRGAGTLPGERLPCLLFLHGGGWVIGNLESHDRLCRRLANLARICVVAVDYRLAPEHVFPAAHDDCVAALHWVAQHADELAIDGARLGVGGDSAGGTLAAVLALMGRDGTAPRTVFQALLYPVTDLTAGSGSYRRVTGMPLTGATMHWFMDHYIPERAARRDWRASPLLVGSVAGTPPALVLTVGNDPLCDEGRAYAQRLEDEGVRVTALHLGDHLHGMLLHGKLIRASNRMVDFVGATIGAALHDPAP